MVERRKRSSHLFDRHTRFRPGDHPKKSGAAHKTLMRKTGKHERLRRPNLRRRRRPKPGCGLVRQNANDRMRYAVERDAAADDIRIAAQPFAPEILGDKGDVCALLFVRQKIASADWMHA